MNHEAAVCILPCMPLVADPAFEFVYGFSAGVPLIWTTSWNVELVLANDTSFVERLPGDNASTRSVRCEGSACTAPTLETDVLPEIPDMFTTAVLGTSASKRLWMVSTEPVRRLAVAGSQTSPDQPADPGLQDARSGRARASLFLRTDAKLSGPPSSCQDCFESSELSCPVLSVS